MSDTAIRPFSSGTQFGAWRERNCEGCKLYNEDVFDGQCQIDEALGLAYMGGGTVTAEIAQRMGYEDVVPGPWTWDCPERVPV